MTLSKDQMLELLVEEERRLIALKRLVAESKAEWESKILQSILGKATYSDAILAFTRHYLIKTSWDELYTTTSRNAIAYARTYGPDRFVENIADEIRAAMSDLFEDES